MSIDFAALTQAVVTGVQDVRCCLIVSRDGLALGVFPAAEEAKALDAWSRIASLGDVDRGFVAVRDEVWIVSRRGPYATVAIAGTAARPGVVLDRLDQMLLAAEEARLRKEGLRVNPEREAGAHETPRGPRTPLHREPAPGSDPAPATAQRPTPAAEAPPTAVARPAAAPPASTTEPRPVWAGGKQQAEDEPLVAPGQRESAEPGDPAEEDDEEVDRIALAREFSGLLFETRDDEGEG